MRYLKQNTDQYVSVGPFLDKTAGFGNEDALTVTSFSGVIVVSTHASASTHTAFTPSATAANDWGMAAIGHGGLYDLKVPDSEINFVGSCKIAIWYDAEALPAWEEFMVVPANVWDSLMGTDLLQIDMTQILGHLLTQTGTQLADGFQTYFDVASPTTHKALTGVTLAATQTGVTIPTVTTLTNAPVDSSGVTEILTRVPDATAGASGGLLISGSNAGTTTLGALTITGATTFTGAITAAAANAIAGTIATVTTVSNTVAANLTQILGTALTETSGYLAAAFKKFFNIATPASTMDALTLVATATNLTNLPAVPTDWLTAAGVKADAVTKIQTGLATPTNITAGTISTVTNLTNAPTNGDLTAAMKASVNAEVDTALNTAIPGSPVADSINERIVAIDAYGAPPTAAAIVDAAWDEVLHTDHEVAGSASVLLQAAGGAADPLLNAVPGSYGAGTAGYVLGTNLNAPVATVDTVVDGIATTLGAAGAGLTALATATNLATVDTVVDAIKAKTDNLPSDPADESLVIAATDAIMTRIGAAGAGLTALGDTRIANLDATISSRTKPADTQAAVTVAGSVTGAVGSVTAGVTVTTNNDKTGYALSSAGVTAIWAEVVEGTTTAVQAVRGMLSALFGKLSGATTPTITIRDLADSKNRIVATVDADGNRTAITKDLT